MFESLGIDETQLEVATQKSVKSATIRYKILPKAGPRRAQPSRRQPGNVLNHDAGEVLLRQQTAT